MQTRSLSPRVSCLYRWVQIKPYIPLLFPWPVSVLRVIKSGTATHISLHYKSRCVNVSNSERVV
jgi:hypothetical protein